LKHNTDQWCNSVTQFQEIEGLNQEKYDAKCFKYSLEMHTWLWAVDSVEDQSVENVESEVEPCVRSLEEFDAHLLEHLHHDEELEYGHGEVDD